MNCNIAVLLTVHNRKESTLRCLNALMQNDALRNKECDVYLTDDGCTDGTPDAVRELYPNAIVIKGNGNLYWNRGMYKAWEVAAVHNYDYYLWLNDDTFVYPMMLESLLNLSKDHDDKAIIIGPTVSTDHSVITYGGRNSLGKLIEANGTPCLVDHFNGNIVLVPRYVYSILGNLDYYYHHSKGDFDYGLRAKKKGICIYQVGKYIGTCDNHPSLSKWCNPEISIRERWVALWKPTGMPPHETFYFDRKHKNVFIASIHYFSIILRCLFPKLWLKREIYMLL